VWLATLRHPDPATVAHHPATIAVAVIARAGVPIPAVVSVSAVVTIATSIPLATPAPIVAVAGFSAVVSLRLAGTSLDPVDAIEM
jgi:hypothetical protein